MQHSSYFQHLLLANTRSNSIYNRHLCSPKQQIHYHFIFLCPVDAAFNRLFFLLHTLGCFSKDAIVFARQPQPRRKRDYDSIACDCLLAVYSKFADLSGLLSNTWQESYFYYDYYNKYNQYHQLGDPRVYFLVHMQRLKIIYNVKA